jgi:hypothetical protein
VAVAAGLALPFLLRERAYVAGQYYAWFANLWGDRRDDWPLLTAYRDFRLLCRVWLTPLGPGTYAFIQLAAGAVAAGLCIAAKRVGWPRRRLSPPLLLLSCCWMTVFGPATESPTYALLAPGLAWALMEAWLVRRHVVVRGSLGVSAGLLVAAQIALWFPHGARIGSLGPQPLAALLLWGTVLATAVYEIVAAAREGCEPIGEVARAA